MIYGNSELKYMECNFCGKERECFVQHKYGKEQAVCPYCLSITYCY